MASVCQCCSDVYGSGRFFPICTEDFSANSLTPLLPFYSVLLHIKLLNKNSQMHTFIIWPCGNEIKLQAWILTWYCCMNWLAKKPIDHPIRHTSNEDPPPAFHWTGRKVTVPPAHVVGNMVFPCCHSYTPILWSRIISNAPWWPATVHTINRPFYIQSLVKTCSTYSWKMN